MKYIGKSQIIAPLTALVVIVIIWNAVIQAFNLSALILPPPNAVLSALFSQFSYLIYHTGWTMLESVMGFLLGAAIAILLAFAFQSSRFVELAVYPYAVVLKAVPLVALAPLVVVWFGSDIASKIVLAAVISFFPILVNTLQGLRSVDPEVLDLMETMSAKPAQIMWKIRIPTALPSMFSGFRVSSSFAVVGAVVAEFVGANKGIGYVIKSSSYYLDTDITFAAILISGIAGLSFFGAISFLERKIVFWGGEDRAAVGES